MAKQLAIAIEKGGSGKTTTAVNLAVLFGAAGKRVLLVDTDKQGNATLTLTQRRLIDFSGGGVFGALGQLGARPVTDYILESACQNVWVLPSCPEMDSIEDLLRKVQEEKFVAMYEALRELLAPVQDAYDLIVYDCPPALSNMTKGALVAASHVLIPLKADGYSVEGCVSTIALIDLLKKKANTALALCGILLTMVDKRTKLVGEMRAVLEESGYPVRPESIGASQAVNVSTTYKQPVVLYDPACTAAKDYKVLAAALMKEIAL